MQFNAASADITTQKSPCLVVPLFEGKKLPPLADQLNRACDGAIQALVKDGDIKGKAGDTLVLHRPPGGNADRILLAGFGKAKGCTPADFRKATLQIVKTIGNTGSKSAHVFLEDVQVDGRDEPWKAAQLVQQFAHNHYRFESLKSEKQPAALLGRVTLCAPKAQLAAVRNSVKSAGAVAGGVSLARELGNLPGNICTPVYLADQAKKLARGCDKLTAKILTEKQMQELGMGSLLSVAAGSKQPARLIVLEYKGAAKSRKPTVLVGKGITFDTGGISLKPGAAMDEMKFDMCGAASVMGVMQAVSQIKPAINLVGVIAAAENMPSGKATKPGDIVTAMSGKTIEVLNTDAEGRLVLCDALTYAERYKPAAVIDIATLTGACVVALGDQATGLYTNHQPLADKLLAAGQETGDRAWQMPLWDEYKQQLKSNFADLANIGGPKAGSVTAACFLSYFTGSYHWAHLDIAGTAWLSNSDKGATGRPVPLLMNYLLQQ